MTKCKTIMVVDGQGGGLGKAIVEKIKKLSMEARVVAVGTNTNATTAMLKAGADDAATGENAVVYNAGYADFILGGVGIIAANSMLGEISPVMAAAIASSMAQKILIPINKCNLYVAGVSDISLAEKIDEALLNISLDREG